jgi:hypothetical protein
VPPTVQTSLCLKQKQNHFCINVDFFLVLSSINLSVEIWEEGSVDEF